MLVIKGLPRGYWILRFTSSIHKTRVNLRFTLYARFRALEWEWSGNYFRGCSSSRLLCIYIYMYTLFIFFFIVVDVKCESNMASSGGSCPQRGAPSVQTSSRSTWEEGKNGAKYWEKDREKNNDRKRPTVRYNICSVPFSLMDQHSSSLFFFFHQIYIFNQTALGENSLKVILNHVLLENRKIVNK